MISYRALRFLTILVLSVGVSSAVVGQTKAGSTLNTGSRPTIPQPPAPSTVMTPTIILSGNVIVADGSPITEPAYIERICNGKVIRDGHTDFKGYFTITLGPNIPRLGDSWSTAETSGMGNFSAMTGATSRSQSPASVRTMLMSCELRAVLAGFRSSTLRIPSASLGSEIGPVSVGTIVLERMGKSQGITVSATSLNAPKDAKKAYDKGHQAVEKNKLPEAQQDLEKAVQLYPQYAAAWLDLGWLYTQQHELEKARNAFTRAETADERFVPAYVGLASLALRESKWQEVADLSSRVIQMDSVDFPAAFYYNALANYRLGNMDQAEKSARKAETLGAQGAFPQVSLLLGVMLASRGDYSAAADHLRSYLTAAPSAPNAEKVRQQLTEMEKLSAAESQAVAAPAEK